MTHNDALLRLARIVHDLSMEVAARAEFDARQLVRDLETAPFSSVPDSRYVDGVLSCEATAPRTITREEFDNVVFGLGSNGITDPAAHARAIAAEWRLTVEG